MSETLYACTYGGTLYSSTDDGENWTGAGTITGGCAWLAALGDNLYSVRNTTIKRSTDGGANWATVYTLTGANPALVQIWTFGSALYALGYTNNLGRAHGGTILRSTNGTDWTAVLSDTDLGIPTGMDANGSTLYVGFWDCAIGGEPGDPQPPYGNQVWGSTNGTDWTMTGSSSDSTRVLKGYTYHNALHWSSSANGIWYSNDAETWTQVASSPYGTPWDDGTTMFARANPNVYRSTNDGASWTAETSVTAYYFDGEFIKTGAGSFLVGSDEGVYRSANGGDTWTRTINLANVYALTVGGAAATAQAFWMVY